jgi:hypothetical protein
MVISNCNKEAEYLGRKLQKHQFMSQFTVAKVVPNDLWLDVLPSQERTIASSGYPLA